MIQFTANKRHTTATKNAYSLVCVAQSGLIVFFLRQIPERIPRIVVTYLARQAYPHHVQVSYFFAAPCFCIDVH